MAPWLAYVTWSDSLGGDIYRVRTDGRSRPERLTQASAFYDKLGWTPDGARLVAVRVPRRERFDLSDELNERAQFPDADLVWLPAAGGAVHVVAPVALSSRYTASYYGVPHVTNDSTRVWINDLVDGLVSMRWDGSDRKSHLQIKAWDWPGGDDLGASEALASPNGDRAVVLVNQNLYLVALPFAGGQPPAVSISNLAASPVPARRITPIGADFPGWSRDGRSIHYALGASYFEYDVARADQVLRDSLAAAERGGAGATVAGYQAERVDVRIRIPRERPSGVIALRGARLIT